MIKINLLPPYIYEKRQVRMLALGLLVLIMATAVGGVTYKMRLDASTATMKQQADEAEAKKAQIAQINSSADGERGKIAPIAAKLKFIQDVQKYNLVMPELYQQLARFTYKGVLYRKLTPSATGMTIEAYTPSLSDLGRYLLNMYKADSIFSNVSISAIPGYPSAEGVSVVSGGGYAGPMESYPGMSSSASRYGGLGAVMSGVEKTIKEKGFNFTVACALKTPIAAPAPPGGGAAAPGAPGMAPGMAGPAAAPAAAAPPPPSDSGMPRGRGDEGGGGGEGAM
jgi:hypothetical protein